MTGPNIIQTRRLLLRPFKLQDAEAAFLTFGSPIAMKFISGGPDASVEATRTRLAGYAAHQQVHGFSKWAIVHAASGLIIGDSGLMWLADGSEVELGYRLFPGQWGHGYATEAARAWLERARAHTSLTHVIAFAHPENAASIAVMRKLGMIYRGVEKHCGGMDTVVYVAPLDQRRA